MNPIHFYGHLVLAHRPQSRDERELADEVKDHFKKTLSVDTVVSHLRERLTKRRQREALQDAIIALERELHQVGTDDPRAAALKTRVEEVKKKIGP